MDLFHIITSERNRSLLIQEKTNFISGIISLHFNDIKSILVNIINSLCNLDLCFFLSVTGYSLGISLHIISPARTLFHKRNGQDHRRNRYIRVIRVALYDQIYALSHIAVDDLSVCVWLHLASAKSGLLHCRGKRICCFIPLICCFQIFKINSRKLQCAVNHKMHIPVKRHTSHFIKGQIHVRNRFHGSVLSGLLDRQIDISGFPGYIIICKNCLRHTADQHHSHYQNCQKAA